jgi:hypothetical protein
MIEKWKHILSLDSWSITTESIDPDAVMYDDSCGNEDRYYIGVSADHNNKIAIIYHDRQLTEEDVVHELLHVSFPDWSEDQVNQRTEKLLNQNKDEQDNTRI